MKKDFQLQGNAYMKLYNIQILHKYIPHQNVSFYVSEWSNIDTISKFEVLYKLKYQITVKQ